MSASTPITGPNASPGLASLVGSEPVWARAEKLLDRLEQLLAQNLQAPDWNAAVAWIYRKRGDAKIGQLRAVPSIAPIRLSDLREIDEQKQRITANIAQFLAARPANNMLLTGARGTGKSSLIKACLNEYAKAGLRLIEVDKSDMADLPDIVDLLAHRPERFIIFCDDLSFDEGETGYKVLKSVLDGSIASTSENLLICATSNRRHLLPEYMKDNLSYTHTADGEVHPGEVIEEKISLSDRFGLWLSFYPFSQNEYLAIVEQWLKNFGLHVDQLEPAKQESLVWALERASRSGRVAYQFAKDYTGRLSQSS